MAMTKVVKGVTMDMTPAEVAAHEAYRTSPETIEYNNRRNKAKEMPSLEEKIDSILEYINAKKQAGDVLPVKVTTLLDKIDAVNIKYPTSE